MAHDITIMVELTAHEAAVIKELREVHFGSVTVIMQEGQPIRTETKASKKIEAQDGLAIATKPAELNTDHLQNGKGL